MAWRASTGQRYVVTAAALRSRTAANGVVPAAEYQANLFDEMARLQAQLLSQVGHRLRSPLNAVIGFSELMESEIHGPIGNPHYREYAAHIRASGQALLRSAEDTLAMTALALGRRASIEHELELYALIAESYRCAVEMAEARALLQGGALPRPAGSTAPVATTAVDRDLLVSGHHGALRQALANLMMVALVFGEPATAISITADARGGDVHLAIVATKADQSGPQADAMPTIDGDLALNIMLAELLLDLQDGRLACDLSTEGRLAIEVHLARDNERLQLVLPID